VTIIHYTQLPSLAGFFGFVALISTGQMSERAFGIEDPGREGAKREVIIARESSKLMGDQAYHIAWSSSWSCRSGRVGYRAAA